MINLVVLNQFISAYLRNQMFRKELRTYDKRMYAIEKRSYFALMLANIEIDRFSI